MPTTDSFKVKLFSAIDQSVSTTSYKYAQKIVVFDVMPQINESGSVEYEPIQILHAPTSFLSYKTTPSRQFSIQDIKLISRTPTEARDNIEKLNILRSWRMPYFGDDGRQSKDLRTFFSNQTSSSQPTRLSSLQRLLRSNSTLRERLGAPPEILYFSAYVSAEEGTQRLTYYRGNINRVPVVLTNLSINYPNDVTYIPTAMRGNPDALGGVPFPVIMTLSIELTETHSPYEVNKFNLAKYTNGVLDGF